MKPSEIYAGSRPEGAKILESREAQRGESAGGTTFLLRAFVNYKAAAETVGSQQKAVEGQLRSQTELSAVSKGYGETNSWGPPEVNTPGFHLEPLWL